MDKLKISNPIPDDFELTYFPQDIAAIRHAYTNYEELLNELDINVKWKSSDDLRDMINIWNTMESFRLLFRNYQNLRTYPLSIRYIMQPFAKNPKPIVVAKVLMALSYYG